MNRHLYLLITAAPFLGCSPDTEEPDPSDPIDTGELPYVVHGESVEIPEYNEDTLVSLVEAALAELVTIDAYPLLDAYDALLTHAEPGCPDWLNSDGYTYWVDDCTTEDGTLFDGLGTQNNREDYEDPDGTIWNQRAIYMLGEIQDAEGNGLVATGSASEATGVNIYGQQITQTNIDEGHGLGGDLAAGTFFEGNSSPRLYRWTATGAGGASFVIYIDALTELDSDEVDLLAIEELVIYNQAAGSDCPIEPAGSMSLRMASGEWLDLIFDGPRWDGPTNPDVCDGCGEIWAKEVPLGKLCLDFSVLLQVQPE